MCSKKTATNIQCSNAPAGQKEWPEEDVFAFGNSPTTTPLQKVVGGFSRFEDILENFSDERETLIANLMNLLKSRDKWVKFGIKVGFGYLKFATFADIGQILNYSVGLRYGANI